MKVVAWSNGSLIAVRSFETDPQYSTAEPVSDTSLRHNIALLHLEDPVARTLQAASTEKRQGLGPSTPLVVVGFYSTSSKATDLYDRVKLPFSHAAVTMRPRGKRPPGDVAAVRCRGRRISQAAAAAGGCTGPRS